MGRVGATPALPLPPPNCRSLSCADLQSFLRASCFKLEAPSVPWAPAPRHAICQLPPIQPWPATSLRQAPGKAARQVQVLSQAQGRGGGKGMRGKGERHFPRPH